MATEAQIQANRLNAQKSTGPRTAEGKAIASQNALKHGLLAQTTVIAGEDVGEFEFYRDELLGELAPDGAVESVLAERVVSLSWRLRRAERAQNEAFDALLARDAAFPLPRLKRSLPTGNDSDVVAEETPLGRAVVRDFTHARVLDRLSLYERRIEYSLYKSMNELKKLRLTREAELATENPSRADERWGEPQPACATEATARQTKPIERAKCWSKVGPETAVEHPMRQTNPIGRHGGVESPVRGAEEGAFSGPAGGKSGRFESVRGENARLTGSTRIGPELLVEEDL